jgi:multidrug efflux pump subunit AcrA (membrane-fusion protein)
MKKRLFDGALLTAVLIIFLSLSGCQRIQQVLGLITPEAAEAPIPIYAVNTMSASQGSISDYLALSGDVVAASTVDAYSDAAGKILSLSVSVGRWVNRGDPIAEVDPSRPGMEFIASVVRAPIAGTIVALPAQIGMTISQAVPIARIAGGSGLEIRIYVAERFISRVSLRQNCQITLDAWPGEVFSGRISEISPVVDPASRTMEVRITVNNAGSRLKTGMFANVKIITEQKDNIVKLPSSAMLQRFGEEYVFVAEVDPNPDNLSGYVARKHNIVPGIQIDGMMEVQQGLMPGDEVIVQGMNLLDDGARINIIQRVTPLSSNWRYHETSFHVRFYRAGISYLRYGPHYIEVKNESCEICRIPANYHIYYFCSFDDAGGFCLYKPSH